MSRRYDPRDPEYASRVRDSFGRQAAMAELAVTIAGLEPGRIELRFPFDRRYTQQHGFLHAGIVTTVLDSACGYAAYSLMPPGVGVLSVELKVNFLAPAAGEVFLASAEVIRPGRTITVCQGIVTALQAGDATAVAAMQATIMAIEGRDQILG